MAARNYSSVAQDTVLSSGIGSGDTSLTVDSATGWPAAPFILVVEPGEANEELILVGSKASNVFSSLTRGYDSSTAVAHSASAVVKHVYVAADARLVYTHDHASAGDFAQVDYGDLDNLPDLDQYATDADLASHAATKINSVHGVSNMQALGITGGVDNGIDYWANRLSNLTTSYQNVFQMSFTKPSGWSTALIIFEADFNVYKGIGADVETKLVIDGNESTYHRENTADGETVPGRHRHSHSVSGNCTMELKATMIAGSTGTAHVLMAVGRYIAIKTS